MWHGNLGILVCPPQQSSPVLPACCCWCPTSKVSALCAHDCSGWLNTPWSRSSACATGTYLLWSWLLNTPCGDMCGERGQEMQWGSAWGRTTQRYRALSLFVVERPGLLCERSYPRLGTWVLLDCKVMLMDTSIFLEGRRLRLNECPVLLLLWRR